MMYYIVIRKQKDTDTPAISEVIRNAYISNVFNSWLNTLFSELTFQLIVLLSALLFICLGVPLFHCLISIPVVVIILYVIIYGSLIMKAAQVMYEKKPLMCWVAEAYEPLLITKNPDNCWYKIVRDDEIDIEELKLSGCQRKVIGTIAVMKHFQREDWCWLFRLGVEKRYRRKGVALKLIQTVQNWCHQNHFNNIELVLTECQDGARELFNVTGFDLKQLYHKKVFTSAVTLQMFQLRCEVRPTF
ncbi:uncharacterized protein LOC108916689 [Anoplophora glabripennis]|uniref:uncharacterized protein LOC108916689 n=1 Tax=Anoplophora glabripennis TaxID=217634 RepID=UPI000874AB73|nr:uncharacterized protein LOC108916689 [Anoplophora glabripennis]